MVYRLANLRAAVKAAQGLNANAPDGIQYRARRYPGDHGFMKTVWGVVKLERVPDSLLKHWPDGFKPCGFVWFGV